MGFLDELRKQKEASERPRGPSESEIREQARKQSEYEAKQELKKRQAKYMSESSFPRIARELSELVGTSYRYSQDNGEISLYWGSGKIVAWKGRQPIAVEYGIVINADGNGTIHVNGGFRGSSTLSRSEWFGRTDVQERALEKAWKHPREHRYDKITRV